MFDTAIWAAITPKITLASFGAMAPALTLIVTAILLVLFVSFRVERDIQIFTTFVGLGVAAFLLWAVGFHRFPEVDPAYAAKQAISYIEVDAFTIFFQMLFLVVAAVTCLLSIRFLAIHQRPVGEFFALVLFATVGMMALVAARDLLLLYLALEMMSLTTYVLVGFLAPEKRSIEAAIKYFLVGAMGSAIFLFGLAFLYGATGTMHLDRIGQLAADTVLGTTRAQAGYFLLGATFLLAGFAFKVAAVPFHMWAPDVYDGAPTPITMMMAVAVKAAAFAVFARVFVVSLDLGGKNWLAMVLVVLSAATMIWGNVAAIAQRDLKRLLAYSSIAHAGYMLMALVAREELALAMSSLRFYLFVYMLTTFGAFTVLLIFERRERSALAIDDYAGLASRYPVSSAVLSLFLLSMAGIPPTAGFLGKWFVFSAAIKTGHIVLAVLGVLTSLVSVYYYTRVIYTMYMLPTNPNASTHAQTPPYPYEQRLSISLAALILLLGLFPDSIAAITQRGSLDPIAKKSLAALRLQREQVARRIPPLRAKQLILPTKPRPQHHHHHVRPIPARRAVPIRRIEPVRRAEPIRRAEPVRRVEPVRRAEPIPSVVRAVAPASLPAIRLQPVVREMPPSSLPVMRAIPPSSMPAAPTTQTATPTTRTTP